MLRRVMLDAPCRRLQAVGGFQFARLEDDLGITDFRRVTGTGSGLVVGTTIDGFDRFETDNQFSGVAVGMLGSARNRAWTLDVGMQLALGNNRAKVRIDGSTTAVVPLPNGGTDTSTTAGGLLALPTNIGNYEDDIFAVIPQLNVALGYHFNPQTRAIVGYRFFYWSQVARSADQIDLGVNLSQLDPGGLNGEPRPEFEFLLADFWAQGINVGLDYRF